MNSPETEGRPVAADLQGTLVLLNSGRFDYACLDFSQRHRSTTNTALHLYDYHGQIRFGDDPPEAIAPGHLTISVAGGETRYHLPQPGRHWCIHYRIEGPLSAPLRVPRHLVLGKDLSYITSRLARICALHARGGRNGPAAAIASAAAGAALQELLCTLAIRTEDEAACDHRGGMAVERAAALVAERFAGVISIPALAGEVGLSQNWLAARFRARFGMTILRYQQTCRIERARFLLTTTDLAVNRIAAEIGIPDPHHFNKLFRRIAGLSPLAARQGREPATRRPA